MEEIRLQTKQDKNYQVSNLGNVKSKQKQLALCKSSNGYLFVGLGNRKKARVHRLVAEAFIPNPDNKHDVNHINGNKHDNRLENLEWATRSENMIHSFTKLGQVQWNKGKFGIENDKSRKILQMDMDWNNIKLRHSMSDIERELKIPNSNICKVCKGIRKSAHNFRFKYI